MPSHRCPRSSRFGKFYVSACKIIFACLFAAVTVLFFSSPAHAQGGVPLVTVATDQTPLNLSNQFGIPTGTAINHAGDFAFVGNGSNALFFRAAGATSVTRLLQVGDEVPGFPGSQILSFSPTLRLNSAKVVFFTVNFTLVDGLVHDALLTYDGAAYHTIVSSDDIAPGSGGVAYGTGLQPVGIDDKGDVAFSSKNSLQVPRSPITLYIALSGASPVRVVGTGDQLPCPSGAQNCFPGGNPVQFLSIFSGLNTRGEILFGSGVSLYVGSTAGVVPVTMASSGPCSSSSSSFVPEGRLNNSGMIAFTNATGTVAALCIAQPAGGAPTVAIVNDGDPAPPPIVNGTLTLPSPVTINDAGDVLFESGISGKANHGLFRHHQSAGTAAVVDVVAYTGEAAPGVTNGDKFASFFFLSSMANDGHVSFETSLTTGRNAVYQQSGAGIPTLVALDGQPAPPSLGGAFGFSGFTPVGALDPVASLGPVVALDNNSTFFASAIAGGTAAGGGAYFADLLYTPTGIQVLMSTGDSLPSASRISLATARPKAAGHFVAFAAQEAGGRIGLFVSDSSSGGSPAKVVSEGDVAPTTGGVVTSVLADEFFVNAKGQVAIETPLTGGPSAEGIFIWTQTAGLTKVVADGDASPIAGTTFLSVSLGGLSFSGVSGLGQTSSGIVSVSVFFSATNPAVSSLLNDSGQLAFLSVLVSRSTPSNAIFLYDPSGTITKIAATGDSAPNGQTFVYVSSAHGLNSAGMVAFDGDTTTSTSSLPGPAPIIPGMFIGSASLAPQQIGFSGNNLLSTSLNLFLGLSDAGDVGFEEFSISGGQTGLGVFTGTGGGTPHVIAMEGMTAPGGGTFSLGTTFTNGNSTTTVFGNIAGMDSKSDIALRAGIAGGNTDSGYFRLLQTTTGTPQLLPVVLQGQSVPGGGTFDTIPIPNTRGADFSLGPDGALAFLTPFTSGSSKHGLFVARADGIVVRALATGDIAPGGGLVDLLAIGQGLAAGDPGKFAFWAGIQGGSARQAIFATAIPAGTVGTTTALGSAQATSVFGQPITLTATVNSTATPAPGTPSGNVSFFNNGVLLGTSTLNAGQAALNISSLPAGADSIVAQYSGDSNFAPSNSSPLAETIAPRTTSTAVASSQNPIIGGQPATFTATVTAAGIAPTGTVTFLDGSSPIGTGALDSSAVATLNTSKLTVGSRSITARYEGDANSFTSTSSALTEDVNIAGFAPPPANLAVTAGNNLVIPLTLYAAPGSNLQFTLSCSGLPANASCAFGSNPVTPASPPNGTLVQLTLSTKAASASLPAEPRPSLWPMGLLGMGVILSSVFAIALVGFQLAPRRRLAFGMCLAVFGLAAVIAGCGSVSSGSSTSPASPGTPAGPAAITVTATSGTTMVSTVIHMTVQ